MKYFFLSILLLAISPILHGQNEDMSVSQKSITLSNTYSGILNGFIISPMYTWEKSNKNISVGPTILWSIGDQLAERAKLKLTGIQATYQGFPTRTQDKINLYFQSDLIIQRVKDEANSVVFNPSTNSFDPFKFKKVDSTIQLYFGYGLDWSLNEKISIIQSVGLGSILTMRNTESGFEDFSDTFFDTDWMIKFGVKKRL